MCAVVVCASVAGLFVLAIVVIWRRKNTDGLPQQATSQIAGLKGFTINLIHQVIFCIN